MVKYITLAGNAKDISGQRFERLVALGPVSKGAGGIVWLCRCDCGNSITASAGKLRAGYTRSCGCLKRQLTSLAKKTHGMTNDPLYQTWENMKTRCFNSNCKNYADYGGRGITVCEEWRHDFQAFLAYVSRLSDCGRKGYTLDRIDNDGNYEPGNIRWASKREQDRNRRSNQKITYGGKTQCLQAWADELGIHRSALSARLRRGWSIERAFLTPTRNSKEIDRDSDADV